MQFANHWQSLWVASQTIVLLLTSLRFGPCHTQISPELAPNGIVQPELLDQVLPESEHKQPETGFNLIRAHQPGIAWLQWHSEQGTHVWAYLCHLGYTLNTQKVMGEMRAICLTTDNLSS